MIKARQWPGLLCCCAGAQYRAYSDIGNVAYEETRVESGSGAGVAHNSVSQYRVVLLWKDGSKTPLTAPEYLMDTAPQVRAFHHYMYGRNNPAYEVPETHTLEIPAGAGGCAACCLFCYT
jgi:hypothetical protein